MKETTLTKSSDFNQLAVSVARDIPTAISDLESIRNEKNHDEISWAQIILTACGQIAEAVVRKEVAL